MKIWNTDFLYLQFFITKRHLHLLHMLPKHTNGVSNLHSIATLINLSVAIDISHLIEHFIRKMPRCRISIASFFPPMALGSFYVSAFMWYWQQSMRGHHITSQHITAVVIAWLEKACRLCHQDAIPCEYFLLYWIFVWWNSRLGGFATQRVDNFSLFTIVCCVLK